MEEYLKRILRHLPIQFADEEANEFVEYLSEAYLENLEKEKYQFAFTAFHMLNMIFVYKTKWFLKGQHNQAIEDSLHNYIQQNRGTTFNTVFDLSLLPEKRSLEALLQSLNFHANDIGICKNHVDVRNNCSHASGRIYYKTKERVGHYIEEEIEFVEKIQNKLKTELKKYTQKFLDENWQQSFLSRDFKDLFEENYFSVKDLELISQATLPLFRKKSNNEKNVRQKILYLLLIYEIQNQINNGENLFLEKLPILMIDLPEKIKIEKNGNEDEIYTSEIIEEFIMSIISDFSNEERVRAEEILGLVAE